ncbi:MAG: hypothetical protein ACI3YT_09475 [Prevotella sp.]|nr:hypothetical protein [Prevotella sp.]
MKKVILAICIFCFTVCVVSAASIEGTELIFGVCFDESDIFPDKPRTPIKRPTAYLMNHTLYIYDCEGCMLRILKNNEVIYSIVINSDMVELPESLTGLYELQVVRGEIRFWTEIEQY